MAVRRILAQIEWCREVDTTCGKSYRMVKRTVDVTWDVLFLDHAEIRKLNDDSPHAYRIARKYAEGSVTDVSILQAVLDTFGVYKLREITVADVNNARVLFGLVSARKRTRPIFKRAAKRTAKRRPGRPKKLALAA